MLLSTFFSVWNKTRNPRIEMKYIFGDSQAPVEGNIFANFREQRHRREISETICFCRWEVPLINVAQPTATKFNNFFLDSCYNSWLQNRSLPHSCLRNYMHIAQPTWKTSSSDFFYCLLYSWRQNGSLPNSCLGNNCLLNQYERCVQRK